MQPRTRVTIAGGTQYAQEQYATQSISVANTRGVLCVPSTPQGERKGRMLL